MRPSRRLLSIVLTLLAALILAAGATGPASAKKKKAANPLVGKYTGTTEEGSSVSFTVTKRGTVVNFTAASTLICSDSTTLPATVSAAGPVPLNKPVPGYPKGKRFDYSGPCGNPAGSVDITGKVAVGFRGMEGYYRLYRVPSGSLTCRDDVPPVGLVSWDARKAGGK
jgi:hypothetical protein